MRCALLFIGLLLVGCGAAPNASATQSRTSEIVELTVAARLLPTANAAIPPTPIQPAIIATPTGENYGGRGGTDHPSLITNSWVAYSQTIGVRFFAPPSLVESPEFNNDHRYSLGSPSNVYDFEALDIYRSVGIRGGDFARTWDAELEITGKVPNVGGLLKSSGPRLQQVGAYQGNVGQFNYVQVDNQSRISGTMWVGQVGGDEVLIIYRCTPAREPTLDAEFAQVIATIDFNAR